MDRNKNAGFSLIELVVAVAILAVFSIGVCMTVFTSSSRNARSVATEINSALSEARVQALSKSDASLEFAYDDSLGKYVLKPSYNSEMVLNGSNRVKIQYTESVNIGDAETLVDVTDTDTLTLTYDRSTGGFQPIRTDGTDKYYCRSIRISGGSKTYVIKLSTETGRNTLSTE
jgi:prepilin-type N-terminal cleavage/methylation domain-containing protein